MPDYKTIDLSHFANVGIIFAGESANLRIGPQSFHALPFQIAADHLCPVRLPGASGSERCAWLAPVVAVGGEWSLSNQATAEYMLTLIEVNLAHIQQRMTHHHGEADHLEYLSRPFQKAIQAIHRKMHQLGIPP